jgi:hypothetical protein
VALASASERVGHTETTMRAMMHGLAVVGFAALLGATTPAGARADGARLYEMTENMRITSRGDFTQRRATSELIGTADVGTPLCPPALVAALSPQAKACTINATGSDNINLATGLGDFVGTFTVVVAGDNPVDSPEWVVLTGTFKGKMDFSPAVLLGIPLGHVTGTLQTKSVRGNNRSSAAFPFTGTFRLPFVLPVPDQALFGDALLPLAPMDRYDLTRTTRPLYLLDDMANVMPVQASEFGAGWATVKFEINF